MRILRRPLPAAPITETPTLAVTIDRYWCDPHGTHVTGWAHCGGFPVNGLTLATRSGSVATVVLHRPDLPVFFGGNEAMATAGFSAYLPGPPDVELEFLGETGHLAVRCIVPAPRHPLPVVPTDTEGRDWRDAAREAIEAAPPGRVLALGVRTGRAEDDRSLREKFPNREVIGVDIHPGIGVDLVADVHELDLAAGVASAAIVYSGSLLEHVAAPWLVARACATVLVPGGYALHHAPWAWPTHARPNDFWRMSPDGLRQLFTPMLGFEVVETGSSVDVRMQVEPHPFSPDDPRLPLLAFSTTHSAATSWIIARKTTEPPAVTEWPYTGTEVAALAARYPVDGIAVSSD